MENIEDLVKLLKKYNKAYRKGKPLVSDLEYDRLLENLQELSPYHPFLRSVEPEKFDAKKEVRHPVPMLSTEKTYTKDGLEKFIARVDKAANEIGIADISFSVTPKLDGLAGRDDGTMLATRGNGETGYDISNSFNKGIIPAGGRGLGLGELVIVMSYFEEHLSDEFEHPRNMVVGIISSDTLNEFAKKALQNNMVHFVPYSVLPKWTGSAAELLKNIEKITTDLTAKTDYPIDGMIAEVTNEDVKNHMGATAHHYRWQIAIKTKGETAITTVEGIKWQVGRTGNITPVLEIRPVYLSGATIRNVTAHHAGLIQKKHLGVGAEIEVVRSGEVIPKLEKVVTKSYEIIIPERCPSCGTELEWNNDFLKCNNSSCKAQIEQSISHWFKTLGNADWFGIKTIQKLVENNYDCLEKIYSMSEDDFKSTGFGPVQSKNLKEAINISKNKPVEDWRFLAAFGISNLGKGDSRKLLSHMKIEELIDAKAENIKKIPNFGPITSSAVEESIKIIKPAINHMLSIGFNLERTLLTKEQTNIDSAIVGKHVVFTGKMNYESREKMQEEARRLGAIVQTSISSKTDYLIRGEKAGSSKIEKAKKMSVIIISEEKYNKLINKERGRNNTPLF